MSDLREIQFSELKHMSEQDDGHQLPIMFSCFISNENNAWEIKQMNSVTDLHLPHMQSMKNITFRAPDMQVILLF